MFVRQKKNRSGIISVQVVSKATGVYKVAKTIGSSADALKIKRLVADGGFWIQNQRGLQTLDFEQKDHLFDEFLSSIQQIKVSGTALISGKIFDDIGFNAIKYELFKS